MPTVKSDKAVKGKPAIKNKKSEAVLIKVDHLLTKTKSSARKRGAEETYQNGGAAASLEVTETPNEDAQNNVPTALKSKRATRKTPILKEDLVEKQATSSLSTEKAKPTRKRKGTEKAMASEMPQDNSNEEPSSASVPKKGRTTKAKKDVKVEEKIQEEPIVIEEPKAKRGRAIKVSPNVVETVEEKVVPKNRSRKLIAVEDVLEKPAKKIESKAKAAVRGTKKKPEPSKEKDTADSVLKTSNSEENNEESLKDVLKAVLEEIKPKAAKTTQRKTSAKIKVDKKKMAAESPVLTTNIEDENVKKSEAEPEPEEEVKEKNKSRKRAAKTTNDEKIAKVPKNSTTTVYDKDSFALSPTADGEHRQFSLKISSWNVAGLRSWIKKDGLKYLDYEEPDILCLQETKCAGEDLPDEAARLPGYHPYWLCMPGGYAGVAIYSKIMPIHVEYGIGNEEFDANGRIITAEYEKFYLVNVYVPNSGRKLVNLAARMQWEQLFLAHVNRLDKIKAVIICGDMNVSHEEIDLANPKSNTRNAGFTPDEREKMTKLLSNGFVDTFRELYPDRTGAYTYWTYMANARSRNVGWRLDYFITSKRLMSRVVDNVIRAQCKGSDHCPITLFLNL